MSEEGGAPHKYTSPQLFLTVNLPAPRIYLETFDVAWLEGLLHTVGQCFRGAAIVYKCVDVGTSDLDLHGITAVNDIFTARGARICHDLQNEQFPHMMPAVRT